MTTGSHIIPWCICKLWTLFFFFFGELVVRVMGLLTAASNILEVELPHADIVPGQSIGYKLHSMCDRAAGLALRLAQTLDTSKVRSFQRQGVIVEGN